MIAAYNHLPVIVEMGNAIMVKITHHVLMIVRLNLRHLIVEMANVIMGKKHLVLMIVPYHSVEMVSVITGKKHLVLMIAHHNALQDKSLMVMEDANTIVAAFLVLVGMVMNNAVYVHHNI
jgi:hypothetical protein